MSNDKPGQRKAKSSGRAQGDEIAEAVSAAGDDEDQDEISAEAQAGTEDEEEQNGKAQQTAARRDGPQSAPGHKREGFDARGGRNARER
jgi:hypothetical protein